MENYRKQSRGYTQQSIGKNRRLILLIGLGLLFIAIIASVGLLFFNILPSVWATILSIALPTIAVLFTFFQWVFPLSPQEPTPSTSTPQTPVVIPISSILPTNPETIINAGKVTPISQDARKDFFISYSNEDRKWAEWIAWQLEETGYSVIIQAWDFLPGTNFVQEMEKAVKEAQSTILVVSSKYLKDLKNRREWATTLKQDQIGKQSRLIPVCVEDCRAELARILPILSIDLFGLDEAAARQNLLEGVRFERAKPAVAPSFPGSVSA